MADEFDPHEIQEQIEKLEEAAGKWRTWLALTTALIAVVAAVISLVSGYYADRSLLEKNNAVLLQSKASDQWSYYQAKGVKKNVAEGFANLQNDEKQKKEVERYAGQQEEIKTKAEELEHQVQEANDLSSELFEKHHRLAMGVTFLQIAIALSAMSALMNRKSFWVLSIITCAVGIVFACVGMFC
jgi:ATP-dependent Clp protease ATP-binding subunit ClpA